MIEWLVTLLVALAAAQDDDTFTCTKPGEFRVTFFTNVRSRTNFPLELTIFDRRVESIAVESSSNRTSVAFHPSGWLSDEQKYQTRLVWITFPNGAVQEPVRVFSSLDPSFSCSYTVTLDRSPSAGYPDKIFYNANMTRTKLYSSDVDSSFARDTGKFIIATNVQPLASTNEPGVPCGANNFLTTSTGDWDTLLQNANIDFGLRGQFWEYPALPDCDPSEPSEQMVSVKLVTGEGQILLDNVHDNRGCLDPEKTYRRRLLNQEGQQIVRFLRDKICFEFRKKEVCDEIGVSIYRCAPSRAVAIGIGVTVAILVTLGVAGMGYYFVRKRMKEGGRSFSKMST